MRKKLLSLFAAATMLLATSCSDENNFSESNKQSVTFKVKVEGAGVGSRTIADGENHITIGRGEMVDKLFYGVYESGKTECLWEGQAVVANGVATIVIPLVNGLKYDLVFMAYNAENNAFGISKDLTFSGNLCETVDLTNLTLKNNLVANQEAYDAFYHVESNYVTNTASTTPVTLKRMFAQLNVATTDTDLSNAKQLNADITQTAILLKKVPNAFNARTGEVTGEVEVTYSVSNILKCSDESNTSDHKNEQLTVTIDGEEKNFNYLAMAYVLAGAESSLHDVEVSFYRGEEENVELVYTRPIASVPLQRQYRTNVTGNILTQQEAFNIDLDTDWGNHNKSVGDVVVVATAEGLQKAIDNAQEGVAVDIQVTEDINLGESTSSTYSARSASVVESLTIAAGKIITIDLNGKTIEYSKACTESYQMINNRGTLTIKDTKGDGKISFKDIGDGDSNFGWGSYTIRNEGTLIVENGTIEHLGEQNPGNGEPIVHMYCAIYQYSGSTTINGGKISTPTYRSARLWKGEMIINDGEFEGQLWVQAVDNTANLTINGGSFTPKGNDGSSVFVSNKGYDAVFSVTGGTFETKIGCGDADKLVGCIAGGKFTEDAKTNTESALFNDDYTFVEEGGYYVLTRKPDVAKIGEVGYTTLMKAIAAVEDGGTITLVANETFTADNYSELNEYYEGLYYEGDKSFTIDLNDKTIGNDNNKVDDYLILFRNDGSKANVINFKNGTIDAGTSAYCAICTSVGSTQKITINLEDINVIGNNSDGGVLKIRGGAELNVNDGTVITGNDNYVGIEAVGNNTVVNIYEGAEIYQKGTSSNWGWLVGASSNSTVNVYGGEGTSAKGVFGAMTSGGTINISGGEWIANTDGTVANDNNGVLIAQSDKQYNSGAGNAVVNVTGGTFKGGYNCYGNAEGDAQINISGGNFNADPTAYLADGYRIKAGTTYEVEVAPAAKIGETEYASLQEAFNAGGEITLLRDVTLSETVVLPQEITATLDLNGKILNHANETTSYAINNLGTLTIEGEGTVNARGIYNGYDANGNYVTSAKLTIESGTFNAKGTNGGAAVYNYGILDIDGGHFESNGGYGLNNQASGVLTVDDAEVKGGIYNKGTVTVGGSSSVYQHLSSKHAIYNWAGRVTIENGTFDSESGNELILADGEAASVVIKNGTFKKTAKSWLFGAATGKNISFEILGGTHSGYVNEPEKTVDAIRPYQDPIVVKGGTYNFDPTSWVPEEGYKVSANTDNGTWTVVENTSTEA